MRAFSAFHRSELTLKRKLFAYMLILALVLAGAMLAGLFLFGRLNSTQRDMARGLELQLAVFEKDICTHAEEMAVMGLHLSQTAGGLIEETLAERGMDFGRVTDDADTIAELQQRLLQPLYMSLRQTACSGAFIMLNATVNSGIEDAALSRSGLYLQINGSRSADSEVLLYRGMSNIGKQNGFMPHRKWRLEFRTDMIPNYEANRYSTLASSVNSYSFTQVFTLPGTSERAVLMTVPIIGNDGTVYGLCGFEVSASFFKAKHAQPANFTRMLCLVGSGSGGTLVGEAALSSGVLNGYYLAPDEEYRIEDAGGGLLLFRGDSDAYIGLQKQIYLEKNTSPMRATVMVPKADYDNAIAQNNWQALALSLMLLVVTAGCCLYFSRRFIAPVLDGLERLKNAAAKEPVRTDVAEINDVAEVLNARDKEQEETCKKLEIQRDELRDECENAQAEISRLTEKRRQDIDAEAYNQFLLYLHTLTAKEKEIFDLYKDGRSAKEIQARLNINENTLKYHNRNIYTKLGVSSRKQLLLYATLMKSRNDLTP